MLQQNELDSEISFTLDENEDGKIHSDAFLRTHDMRLLLNMLSFHIHC